MPFWHAFGVVDERFVDRWAGRLRREVPEAVAVLLGGSHARGDAGPHSDVDLLVIKSGAHRLELTGQIYRHMHGVGEAVDIIVVTPEDVERYRDSHALVIAPALREGKVVYVA